MSAFGCCLPADLLTARAAVDELQCLAFYTAAPSYRAGAHYNMANVLWSIRETVYLFKSFVDRLLAMELSMQHSCPGLCPNILAHPLCVRQQDNVRLMHPRQDSVTSMDSVI